MSQLNVLGDREPSATELKGALGGCYKCSSDKGGCMEGCPADIKPRDLIRLWVSNGEFGQKEAARRAINADPLGLAAAKACDPCMAGEKCRNLMPLPIQELHELLAQYFLDHQDEFPAPSLEKNGKRVAVIGDGPAGLSAAIFLAASGTEVDLFSPTGTLGGLMKNIPRIPKEDLEKSILAMTDRLMRDRFPNLQVRIGSTPKEGSEPYYGAIIATGLKYEVPEKEDPDGEGEHAVNFIREHQNDEPGCMSGKRVVVLGGGKSAVDAAILAKDLGADVEVVYRRDLGSMPDFQPLVDAGIRISDRLAPKKLGALDDKILIEYDLTEIDGDERDDSGKRTVHRTSEEVTDVADMVLWATPGKPNVPLDTSTLAAVLGTKNILIAGDVGQQSNTVAGAVGDAKRVAGVLMDQLGITPREVIPMPKVDTSVEFVGKKLETPFVVGAVPTADAKRPMEMHRAVLNTPGCAGMIIKTVQADDSHVPIPALYMGKVEIDGRQVGRTNFDDTSDSGIGAACVRIRELKAEFPGKLIGVSIMGRTPEEWGILAKMAKDAGADIVECSFSCPQGNAERGEDGKEQKGGMLGQNINASCWAAKQMLDACGSDFPISIKIPTNQTDFVRLVKALYGVGVRYITCANSVLGFVPSGAGDRGSFHPNVQGFTSMVGYTGGAILPATLASIFAVKAACPDIHIMGTGGVDTGDSARQLILAGADVVQVCSGLETPVGNRLFGDANAVLAWSLYGTAKKVSDIVGQGGKGFNFPEVARLMPPHVAVHDQDQCIDCGNCVTTCNAGMAFAMTLDKEGHPVVHPDVCEGCSMCAQNCPTEAIKMEPHKE